VTAVQDDVFSILEGWRLRLAACDGDELIARWDEAWTWATTSGAASIERSLERSDGARLDGMMSAAQRRVLALLEARETERLLHAPLSPDSPVGPSIASAFGRVTYDRVGEALTLVDFRSCRRFVVVGGGPFPAAALRIRDDTRVPEIVALDVDPEAVALGRRLASHLRDGRLRVDHEDGASYDYRDADVVYVANHVTPKDAVLRRMCDTARPSVRVLLREPAGVGRLVAERASHRLPGGFAVLGVGTPNPTFLSRHVLLGRTAHAAPADALAPNDADAAVTSRA
jgi:hypothetical protein